MYTYIAILRGINVSGKNPIRMPELENLFRSLGFKDVVTYIQSGNVIFSTQSEEKTGKLADKIEKSIDSTFGLNVPVLVRTSLEMAGIVSSNPFLTEDTIDKEKLHVTFLEADPAKEKLDRLPVDTATDQFSILGKEIYLYCPDGYGRTKLTNTFFESKLKIRATTRNWRTVCKLAELSSSHQP
jgi:uncharacterized protein (DUF1697 family)